MNKKKVLKDKQLYGTTKKVFMFDTSKIYPHKFYDSKGNFVPCPNRSWHHLGTICQTCGQRG